jgi:N-acetylmuramoyl-L-alanine amidase
VTPEISTLNFSDVPTILVELGNMRNTSDAARMTSREGQKEYADWLLAGIRAALRK